MKVSLIFTINEINTNFSELSFRDDSLGFIPPLSVLTVASIFEQEGVEVQIIDMDAERLTYNDALDKIAAFSPDLLGFTLSTYSFHPILSWIKRLKIDTGLPVIVGGAHVALYPQETMSHKEIDYAIVGEAEIPLPQFVKAFEGGGNYSGIKSLCYRDNGKAVIDKTRQSVEDINSLSYPARHLIKNELYANILSRKKNFTAMISTRGCPYRCAFCDQKTPPYRFRNPQDFVEEVKYNYHTHGIKDFDIYDSTFTANKKRVLEICELLINEGLDIGWTIRSRVDSVNYKVLDALKKAGCHTIMYGVESSDHEILKRMQKDITTDKIKDIVGYTKKLGIETLGFFMIGFPGETEKTIQNTIDFSLTLPLDYIQFTVLVPFPDTEIYDFYRENGLEDYWAEYTIDPSNERKIDLLGTEVTRELAAYYVGLAYRKFYFRPRIIWQRAKNLSSFSELKRLAMGAFGILKNSFSGSPNTRQSNLRES